LGDVRWNGSGGVNDQFLLSKELDVPYPSISTAYRTLPSTVGKMANNRADFMIVGCIIDFLANRKLRHRRLLLESLMRSYHYPTQNGLMLLTIGASANLETIIRQLYLPLLLARLVSRD
jgi:hypothetical protein